MINKFLIEIDNFPKENKGRFCKTHKLENMIYIKTKICQEKDCDKEPSYNYKGQKKSRFCNQHKLLGMINIKDKRCEDKECKTLAYYGPLFESKKHCTKHRTNNEYKKKSSKMFIC